MKILLIADVPFHGSGLSVLGENCETGLKLLNHEVQSVTLFNPSAIDKTFKEFKPDVCLGVGYWNDAPNEILLPKKYNVPTAVWWVSEGCVPKYKDIIPTVDLLLTTSNYSTEIFKKCVPDSKPKTLYIGTDTDFYKPDLKSMTNRVFSTFISSGEVKGAEEALMAIKIMEQILTRPGVDYKYIVHSPHTEYKLEKDYMLKLKKIVESHKLQKYVSLVGGKKFPKSVMPYVYRTLWFYLAPLRMACFGIPLIEAGACGVPTIAGDWEPMSEIIVDGETGILVPHMAKAIIPKYMEGVWYTEEYKMIDSSILAEKMTDLLLDEEKRNKMGENARKRVVEHFNVDKQIKKLEKELLKIA